jgi:putative membrane protein
MIDYNPKDWFKYIFYFHKADTTRKLLPMIVAIGVYSSVLAYILLIHLRLSDNNDLKNISIMHSLLGFVLSLLLVFRTNTAYDRWWEGRKQWGSLVNSSRNLCLKISGLLPREYKAERDFYKHMVPNFAYSMKNHLRGTYVSAEFEDSEWMTKSDLDVKEHVPNQIAASIFAKTIELQHRGLLLPEHVLLLNNELESFTNICGACERIKNTPIPLSYSSYIKKFIFVYCITLPLGYVFVLHFLIVPFVMFVFYVLASLEVIAEEIEDPFGVDSNDLPVERICGGIRTASHDLLK